jgi:hypothetical protein
VATTGGKGAHHQIANPMRSHISTHGNYFTGKFMTHGSARVDALFMFMIHMKI